MGRMSPTTWPFVVHVAFIAALGITACETRVPLGARDASSVPDTGDSSVPDTGDSAISDTTSDVARDATVVVAHTLSPTCRDDDPWRWSNPTPQGQTLTGVWAAAANDVWAVGAAGTVLHFDGSRWRCVPSATEQNLRVVWGTGSNDVWASGTRNGGAEILHWNGTQWSVVGRATGQNVLAIGGTGPSDVWVISDPNYPALHWDGTAWTEYNTVGSQSLRALWGGRPDDVWAIGFDGAFGMWHWDGASWTNNVPLPFPNRPYPPFLDIWGRNANEVWAVGYNRDEPLIIRWDGREWSQVPSPATGPLLRVWGSGDSDVWILGLRELLHWNGARWSSRAVGGVAIDPRSPGASGLTMIGDNDGWFVSYGGQMVRWSGSEWSEPPTIRSNLGAMWGTGRDDVWSVGGQGAIIHWDGSAWRAVPSGTTAQLVGVWGSGSRDVWAIGGGASVHWDGIAWSPIPVPDATSLSDISGVDASNVWVVGASASTRPLVKRWDGTAWSSVSLGVEEIDRLQLTAVWARSASEVWVVGKQDPIVHGEEPPGPVVTVVLRWDGAQWSRVPFEATGGLTDIGAWGAEAAVYVAGPQGVFRRDGAGWAPLPTPPGASVGVDRIWGLNASHLWAVNGRAIRFWNGSSWTAAAFTVPNSLFASVWGTDNNAWVVGGYGMVLHYGP